MKQLFILIALGTVFLGCKTKPKTENVSEEILVIQQTFEHTTTAVSENDMEELMNFGVKFPPAGSKPTVVNLVVKPDTGLKIHLYTAIDSLFSVNAFRHFYIRNKINKNINPDSILQILQSGKHLTVAAKFSIDSVTYKITKDTTIKKDNNYNGQLRFSRVVFNKNKAKACYYFEQYKLIGGGRGWGAGWVVFVEKRGDKWFFVRTDCFWIA